jgi:hypothetical protein
MNKEIKADDVIFNFFKQICDEKDDVKCVELGSTWINAMKTNLANMEKNLDEADKIKHQENIDSNMKHLNNLEDKSAEQWREYATQCMVEILDNKSKP